MVSAVKLNHLPTTNSQLLIENLNHKKNRQAKAKRFIFYTILNITDS